MEEKQVLKDSKDSLDSFAKKSFLPLVILLSTSLAFGLGRLSKINSLAPDLVVDKVTSTLPDDKSIPTLNTIGNQTASAQAAGQGTPGNLVASKNGKKYHFPWCAGAKSISEVNKIWFTNKEEASRAGYTPAANCPGLK